MTFSDAIMNVLLNEEAQYGEGHGLTCRELERLGTSFHIPRREARGIIEAMIEQRLIIVASKNDCGKKLWKANRKKLTPVGP